ncbi:hypothetical protein EMIT0111MI5_90029 [Burkholderia sp. IT-111MI5]
MLDFDDKTRSRIQRYFETHCRLLSQSIVAYDVLSPFLAGQHEHSLLPPTSLPYGYLINMSKRYQTKSTIHTNRQRYAIAMKI